MYDREVALKTAFNRTVVGLLGIEERDYYSRLTTDQMLNLKTALLQGVQHAALQHIDSTIVCRFPACPPARISVSEIARPWQDRGHR